MSAPLAASHDKVGEYRDEDVWRCRTCGESRLAARAREHAKRHPGPAATDDLRQIEQMVVEALRAQRQAGVDDGWDEAVAGITRVLARQRQRYVQSGHPGYAEVVANSMRAIGKFEREGS